MKKVLFTLSGVLTALFFVYGLFINYASASDITIKQVIDLFRKSSLNVNISNEQASSILNILNVSNNSATTTQISKNDVEFNVNKANLKLTYNNKVESEVIGTQKISITAKNKDIYVLDPAKASTSTIGMLYNSNGVSAYYNSQKISSVFSKEASRNGNRFLIKKGTKASVDVEFVVPAKDLNAGSYTFYLPKLIIDSGDQNNSKVFDIELRPANTITVVGKNVNAVACPMIYQPVCGNDGKTYGNSCQADAAKVKYKNGECGPVSTPTSVRVLYPNGGEILSFGKESFLITFSPALNGPDHTISLIDNKNKAYQLKSSIKGESTDKQSVNINMSDIEKLGIKEGKYKIRVSVNNTGIYDESDNYFTITDKIVLEKINASCGNSAKTYASTETAFTGTFCASGQVEGTPVFPTSGGSSAYKCLGSNNGSNATCNVKRDLPVKTVGVCGSAAKTYSSTETAFSGILCSSGTASSNPIFPAVGGKQTWACLGANGGGNSGTCTATRSNPEKVGGVCGTSNNSCTVGTFEEQNDTTNQFKWRCVGLNGGSTASCNLNKTNTATTTALIETNLKPGQTGSEVSLLQQTLKNLGYYSDEVTGFFGNVTKNAVSQFQSANALEAVGEVGPKTRQLLNSLLGR